MLDFQLQVFKCVVDKKSFSLAAQEMHLTQSAVSQQIQNLESHFGVRLFDRLHRRIMLTEAGKALYPYAVSLERLYQQADKTMQGLMDEISGRLDISASLTVGEYLLPKMLVQFSRLYPLVNVAMDIENTEKVIARVVDGSVGFGFVEGLYETVPTLTDIRCRGDYLVIIASPDRPISCGESPTLSDLLGERWVLREPSSGTRNVFEQFVNNHGGRSSSLNIIMELSSTEAIKSVVKAGLGLGVVSCLAVEAEVSRGELVVVPISEGTIDRNFTILQNRGKFQTRAGEIFGKFIMENMP